MTRSFLLGISLVAMVFIALTIAAYLWRVKRCRRELYCFESTKTPTDSLSFNSIPHP